MGTRDGRRFRLRRCDPRWARLYAVIRGTSVDSGIQCDFGRDARS